AHLLDASEERALALGFDRAVVAGQLEDEEIPVQLPVRSHRMIGPLDLGRGQQFRGLESPRALVGGGQDGGGQARQREGETTSLVSHLFPHLSEPKRLPRTNTTLV